MATTCTAPSTLLAEWPTARPGPLRLYGFRGGRRLIALLHLREDGATLLVNDLTCSPEGRRVVVGWALATGELGEPGWHAMYQDAPR